MEYTFKNSKHNDQKRANKNNRLSDSIADYEDVALEYFKDLDGNIRCALSGELLQEDNYSKEHIIALAIGGHDIAANIAPSAMGYNLIKRDMYLLKYLELQENQEGENIYNPYRLLKMVNYMLKSINARENEIDEYRKAILTPNAIDEYLSSIEINDKEAIYPDTLAPKSGEARKIERNNQEIEYDGEGISMYTFISDVISKLSDEGLIPSEYIEQLESIFENTKETDVFKRLNTEVEKRQEIIRALRDRNIGNEYDIAYIMQPNVSSKEEIEQKIDMILKNISQLLEQKNIDREWASIVLENRPELLINMDNFSTISNTIEFYANQSELEEEFFKDCFKYNQNVREYIEICKKLKELGLDLIQMEARDTLESFLKRQEYDIASIEIEDFPIGSTRNNIRAGYVKTTEEEREILLDLGILEEKHIKKLKGEEERIQLKSASEYIEIFKSLKELGLDLTNMKQSDRLKSFLKRQGYDITSIGIEDFSIGGVRNGLRAGKPSTTEEEREILLELGILEEKHIEKLKGEKERIQSKSASEYIEIFKRLKELGLDLKNMGKSDNLESFLKRQGYDIASIGIEDFKIGSTRDRLRSGGLKITDEEREILLELGILGERHIEKLKGEKERIQSKSASEYIEIFKRLKELGLDLTNMEQSQRLKDFLRNQGRDIASIGIEDFPIGSSRDRLRRGGIKTTEEEREILLELGILEEKHIEKLKGEKERIQSKSASEYIEICKKLKELGLDLIQMEARDTLESFLKRQEYDIASIEIEDFPIGSTRNNIRAGHVKTTEEEREILLELGILEQKHIDKLKQKDEEKAIKAMKKSVAKNVKDNPETRRNIQEQVISMQMSNVHQQAQYASIGR